MGSGEDKTMGNQISCAGNKGPKVSCDCHVTLELKGGGGISLTVNSKVAPLYGSEIEELCRGILSHYRIENAVMTVEDYGAFNYVIAARVEACIRNLMEADTAYLPDLIPENSYGSSRKKMRFSRLYIPGNSPKMMINAGIYGSHGVILDLEDSVAPDKKDEARLLVRNALRQVDFYGAERMVRINQLPRGLADLDEIVPHNVHVVLLPKCESKEELAQVNARIRAIRERKKVGGEVYLMPIIESALGIINAFEIASSENVVAVALGLEDYCADLGVKRTVAGTESLYAKSALVNACKAAGVQPIDSVFSDFQDMEALNAIVQQAKNMGFEGIGCIHPNQVGPVNHGFAPCLEEIAKAREIVRCYEQAREKGLGVVSLGPKMIDAPVVERAIQVIDRAVALGKLSQNWRSDGE